MSLRVCRRTRPPLRGSRRAPAAARSEAREPAPPLRSWPQRERQCPTRCSRSRGRAPPLRSLRRRSRRSPRKAAGGAQGVQATGLRRANPVPPDPTRPIAAASPTEGRPTEGRPTEESTRAERQAAARLRRARQQAASRAAERRAGACLRWAGRPKLAPRQIRPQARCPGATIRRAVDHPAPAAIQPRRTCRHPSGPRHPPSRLQCRWPTRHLAPRDPRTSHLRSVHLLARRRRLRHERHWDKDDYSSAA